MKVFPKIAIKEHIYNGKVSDGKVTENGVYIVLNQESQVVSINARRGFVGIGNQPVSVEFVLDPSLGDGSKLHEVIKSLQTTGQDMIHNFDRTVPFDGDLFASTISIFIFGKEYYVPLENENAKKAIEASGIVALHEMSNKYIVDMVSGLV